MSAFPPHLLDLLNPWAYPHPAQSMRVVETHFERMREHFA
jgi:hypothetical protein